MGSLEYRIVNERGPAHEREFVAEVYMDARPSRNRSWTFQERSRAAGCCAALLKLNVTVQAVSHNSDKEAAAASFYLLFSLIFRKDMCTIVSEVRPCF